MFILALGPVLRPDRTKGLPPEVAIGTGLITEVFGFASGLYAYARKRLIDYRLELALLVVTIPAALLGTWAAGWITPDILKVTLGVGLFAVALSFLRAPEHKDVDQLAISKTGLLEKRPVAGQAPKIARDCKNMQKPEPSRNQAKGLSHPSAATVRARVFQLPGRPGLQG